MERWYIQAQTIYHKLKPWAWVVVTSLILGYLVEWPVNHSYGYFIDDLNWIIFGTALEEVVKFIPVILFVALTRRRDDLIIFALISGSCFGFLEVVLNVIYEYIDYSTPITLFALYSKIPKYISFHALFTLIPSLALYLTHRQIFITKITAVTLGLVVGVYLHLIYNLKYTNLILDL